MKVTPAAFTVIMLLFGAVFCRIPGGCPIMPLFTVINIYYWSVFCPGILPYWFLFLIGIVQDTLNGVPLGVSSLINMLFALVIIRRFRTFNHMSFVVVWLRFITLSAFVMMLIWLVTDLYQGRAVLPARYQFLQWLSSCLAYPFMHFILTHIYRALND